MYSQVILSYYPPTDHIIIRKLDIKVMTQKDGYSSNIRDVNAGLASLTIFCSHGETATPAL
jgi:hypothetical protein